MAAAVCGVGGRPLLNGFFAVKEDEPNGVAGELFAGRAGSFGAKAVGDSHQEPCGGGSVVGADEVDVAQRVVGLVVRGEDDGAGLCAWEAHDEVAHGHGADGSVGGEGVLFELIVVALEVGAEEILGLDVAGAGGPARTDGGELARVLVGFGAVESLP